MDRNICLQSMQVFVVEYSHPLPKPKELVSFGGYTATYTEAAGQPVCLLIINPTAENEKCPSCLP